MESGNGNTGAIEGPGRMEMGTRDVDDGNSVAASLKGCRAVGRWARRASKTR